MQMRNLQFNKLQKLYAKEETLKIICKLTNFRNSYVNKETLEVHMQMRKLQKIKLTNFRSYMQNEET